jgi:hypothetical protein
MPPHQRQFYTLAHLKLDGTSWLQLHQTPAHPAQQHNSPLGGGGSPGRGGGASCQLAKHTSIQVSGFINPGGGGGGLEAMLIAWGLRGRSGV